MTGPSYAHATWMTNSPSVWQRLMDFCRAMLSLNLNAEWSSCQELHSKRRYTLCVPGLLCLFVVLKCPSQILNSKVRKQCQRCAFCTIKRVDTWHHTQIFADVTGKPTSVPHIPSFSIFVTQREQILIMQILVVLVVRRFWCTPWKGRTWWKWGTRKAGQLKGGAVVLCHYVQVFDKLKQKELRCWTTSTWGHSKTRKTLGVSSPMSTQGTDAELERKAMKSRVWYDVIPWFDLPHQLPWHVRM